MKQIGAALAMAVLAAGVAQAQMAGPSTYSNAPTTLPQETPKASAPQQQKGGRHAKSAPSKEEVLADAAAVVKSIGLSCEVSDAALLVEGTATVNGKPVHVRTFETACGNGLGYFLVDQPPEKTQGFSCFGAEFTHDTDVAAGREAQPLCTLPANADTKKAAGVVLSRLGFACQATGLRVIGLDIKVNAELTEVACSGGTGYVIASPLPGALQAVSALSCPDSYHRGVACKLSSNGAPLITLDTFKQALAQHNVPCTVQNLRSVGKESVRKRHVIEFQCPEQPGGLVAFIPIEDKTAPFETMDCITAGRKAQVICTLTKVQ